MRLDIILLVLMVYHNRLLCSTAIPSAYAGEPPETNTTTTANGLAALHQIQPAFVFQAAVPEDEQAELSAIGDDFNGGGGGGAERDGGSSKKIIGSSVVTSVSVILNGKEPPQFTDAVGHKVPKPEASLQVASPINLLNPDRYEFFTFDDNGELVKRLMTMQEIQSIVANGDGEGPTIIHTAPIVERDPEKNVQDIVESVQSVLSKQVEDNKNATSTDAAPPVLDTPDVSSSWSMILPAVFGNTGGDIFPQPKPQQVVMTPESELLETSTQKPTRSTKKPKPPKRKTTQKRRPAATALPTQTTQLPPQTPQVVQEDLDPNESVYTGIQQYQSLASSLQHFDAFSAMNLPHVPHKTAPQDQLETTTRRVFVNNQEIIQTTSNRRPPGATTTTQKPVEITEYLDQNQTKFQQKHVPTEHNKKPANGSRPHSTRRPGTTHKQKIKKKPTATTTKPTTAAPMEPTVAPTIPTTTTTTTTKPETPTTTTTTTTATTTTTTSTTSEPITTSTEESIISPIPEATPISPTAPSSAATTPSVMPSLSTPTKKKKKKPTATSRPHHHPSSVSHAAPSDKDHGNQQLSGENRKPTSQPSPHHKSRPPYHSSAQQQQQPNKTQPAHDSAAASTIQQNNSQKYQYASHHKKRPRPTRPMTTKATTTTSIASQPAAAAWDGLIVQPFPGFGSSHAPLLGTTMSSVAPTFSPIPPAAQYPGASYGLNRYPSQQIEEASEEYGESYLKIQSLPSAPQQHLQQQQQQHQLDEDEDDNTKLSIDQIMLSLKQDESQKLEEIKSEVDHVAPSLEVLDTVKVKGEDPEDSVKLEKMPSEQTSGTNAAEPISNIKDYSPEANKSEGEDLAPVATTRPPSPVISFNPENTINTSKVIISEPDSVKYDDKEQIDRIPDSVVEVSSTVAPQTDPPLEIFATESLAEATDEQTIKEGPDYVTTTLKLPEEQPLEYDQKGDITIHHLYADIAEPVVIDLTTTSTPEWQTTNNFSEETSSEESMETQTEPESIRKSESEYALARLPVTIPHTEKETNDEEAEGDTNEAPLVADLKPHLNLNVVQPTDKITMHEFQTQAATVASSLVDGANNIPADVSLNTKETADELESLMSDVIQQMTGNNPPQKSPALENSNRLTNFAQLNTSFLRHPENTSTPISLHSEAEQPTLPENGGKEKPFYGTLDIISTPEEAGKVGVSKIIPTNEELIRKEEEYLQTIERATEGAPNNSEEIVKGITSKYPLPSLPQIYAQQQESETATTTITTTSVKIPVVSEEIGPKKETDVKWVELRGIKKPTIVNADEKSTEHLSSEDESDETSFEQTSTKQEQDNPSDVGHAVSATENENDENISQNVEEITDSLAEVPENSEFTALETEYTTVAVNTKEENYEENHTEWVSATEINLSGGSTEKEWTEEADGDDASSLSTESLINNYNSFTEKSNDRSNEKLENSDQEKDQENDKATESVPEYIKANNNEEADLERQDLKEQVTSAQPEPAVEKETSSIQEQHGGVSIEDDSNQTGLSAGAEEEKSSELHLHKLLASQTVERSTEISVLSGPGDSEMAETAEEETKSYDDAIQVAEGSITEAIQTPSASPQKYDVDDSLNADPYIKLGELTTKPSALMPNAPTMNAEIKGELNQASIMGFNASEKQATKQASLSYDQIKPEHDEEDEDDQGGYVTELNNTDSTTHKTVTSTSENHATPSQVTATTSARPIISTSTKRLNTLKPVSYFKPPPFDGVNPAEPTNIYSYGNGNANPYATGNINNYGTGNLYPYGHPPSQPQPQQARPMQRPPALSNLMHTSTLVTRPPVKLEPSPEYSKGLEASTANLDEDLLQFTQLCNELAFSYWKSITSERISSARSLIISPFALTSMLSMVFLGARGGTSGEMNEVLKLDDMVTFNPHLVFRNVTESVERATDSDIATAAFVREIFSDRANGKILQFFKEKTQQLYAGHVEEVNFHVVNDIIRRRTNLLIKRHSMGKVLEYLRTNSVWVNGPLATISANLFQTDCSRGSTLDRDGEMFFQVHPSVRQRRLVPIPAVLYKGGFTAGYEAKLDATVVAFGRIEETVSTIYVMPGHQSSVSPTDNLDRLERELVQLAFTDNAWSNILTSLMDRPGMEVQLPRFSHRSFVNASLGLQKMGLKGLFQSDYADLRGLTGASNRDIYLSDMIQINTFSTCGEDKIADHHHVEMYPAPPLRKRNKDVDVGDDNADNFDSSELAVIDFGSLVQDSALGRGFYDDLLDPKFLELPLPLRPRQARVPDTPARLRFDKPFLYFVRHNPTGLILFMGRFNPRLLP